MNNEFKHVRVGCAVFLINEKDQILMGKRRGELGGQTWAIIGGHLEKYETLEHCLIREVMEETNLKVYYKHLVKVGFENTYVKELDRQYLTVYYKTRMFSGELKNMEPDKCSEFRWFDLNDLPSNIFSCLKGFLDKYDIS